MNEQISPIRSFIVGSCGLVLVAIGAFCHKNVWRKDWCKMKEIFLKTNISGHTFFEKKVFYLIKFAVFF